VFSTLSFSVLPFSTGLEALAARPGRWRFVSHGCGRVDQVTVGDHGDVGAVGSGEVKLPVERAAPELPAAFVDEVVVMAAQQGEVLHTLLICCHD
jgi:hypothetical protein